MNTEQIDARYKAYLLDVLDSLPAEMPLDQVKERLTKELNAAVATDIDALSHAAVDELNESFAAIDNSLTKAISEGEQDELEKARNLVQAIEV